MIVIPQNAHEKIIRTMVKLQQDHPFFSYILMNFKVTACDDSSVPTAGVDKHGSFFYKDAFILTLTPEEIQGLLVHECLHIAKGDFFRRGNREGTIWNIASDMVINHILLQEGFKLPKSGINPTKDGKVTVCGKDYNVKGKVTEEVYEELYQNATKIMISGGGGKGKGENGEDVPDHGGFDIHIESPNGETQAEKAAAESKWKKIIIEAATNAQARGKLPGCVSDLVDKILNPTIDWRTRIQRFITNEIPVDYTNRMPGRSYYGTGIWVPKILRENIEVFVGVDVSGSTMYDRVYFIGEVMGILNSYEQIKARLIFWDASVNPKNDHMITRNNKDLLTDLKIEDCNGGTSMSCYADYCEEKNYKCRLHILMTDGYIESDPRVPQGNIIYVLTKSGDDTHLKDTGIVCRLSDVEE
jgi:predicted metal-dependent peptidase